jgi:hypothetical protein
MASYTIYVCPECGRYTTNEGIGCSGGGLNASHTSYVEREPVEVVPRAVADELVAALSVCAHSTQAGFDMKFGALAKYRDAVGDG